MKLRFMSVVVIGTVLLGANAFGATPSCADFTTQFQTYNQTAINNGYYTYQQPLASTQAASDAKVAQLASFLNGMSSALNAYPAIANCPAQALAQRILTVSFQQLAVLQAYSGPWTMPTPIATSAVPSNSITLPLPCGNAPWRSCSDVISDFSQKLGAQFAQIEKQTYQGGVGTFQNDNMVSGASSNGSVLCDSQPAVTNGSGILPGNETSTNFLGQSCGTFNPFNMVVQGSSCVPQWPTGSTRSFGSFPDGQVGGILPFSQDCALSQLKGEFSSVNGMQLSAPPGADLIAIYGNQLYGTPQYSGYFQLVEHFNAQPNTGQIPNCGTGSDSTSIAGQQSSCHLFTERNAIESMYLQIAVIEGTNRAARAMNNFFLGFSEGDFFTNFNAYLTSRSNKGDICYGHQDQCNWNEYSTVCLTPAWNTFYQAQFNRVFPAGTCQMTGAARAPANVPGGVNSQGFGGLWSGVGSNN